MKVVYIAGWMRSGTTLLGELIGAQPGLFNAGEVSGVWAAAARGGVCACGELITACPVWGTAIQSVREELDVSSPELVALGNIFAQTYRTRNTPKLLRMFASEATEWPREVHRVTAATRLLLARAMSVTESTVLVDSSKLVPGYLFHAGSRIDVRMVHIVRDPRAVAASELRTVDAAPGNADFVPPGSGVITSALRWSGANLSVAAAASLMRASYRRVRYEGIVDNPESTLAALMRWLGEDFDKATVRGRTAWLGVSHAAVGNPVRQHGATRSIAVDDRWREELSRAQKASVWTITLPVQVLLKRGYRELNRES